jgi:hypothetical protein
MSTSRDPNEWMAQEIFKLLSGIGHEIYMYDSGGKRVFDPSDADRMFSRTAKMMITLGWTKGKPSKPVVSFHASASTPKDVIENVKRTLKQHNLYDHSFDTLPYGSDIEPRQFAHMNKKPTMSESQWTGSTRTSRYAVGLSEVVITHSQRLDDSEGARRWTKIKSIFVHGADGSRYKFPHKHIGGAKAMAQHINHQGQPWDQGGECIHQLLTMLRGLRRIKSWSAGHDDEICACTHQLLAEVKHTLKRIATPHSYASGVSHAAQLIDSWQAHEPHHALKEVDSCDLSKQAVMSHVRSTQLSDRFPESERLMEWFDQFDWVLSEKETQQVVTAAREEKSKDPRTVLGNLSQHTPGWESRFEQDPKDVLDQIDRVLDQHPPLKKSEISST